MPLSPTEVQVVMKPSRLAVLTAMVDTGGAFDTSTLALIDQPFAPSPDLVPEDIHIATAAGFEAVAGLVFGDPYYDVDGTAVVVSADQSFIATDPDDLPPPLYGYALLNAALDALRAVWAFASPVGIGGVGRGFTLAVWLRYSGN